MKRVETSHYIKSVHYLLNAHFDLRNHREFEKTLIMFEKVAQTDRVKDHDNFRIQAFIYISQARINQHFMQGTFKEGLSVIPGIEKELLEYDLFIDSHRGLVLNYKFAMMYIGSGDYRTRMQYR